MAKHKFPKGYKTWTILNKMNEVNGLTYTEIIKLAYELSHGVGSFDSHIDRGYWSGAFVQAGPGAFPWSFKRSSGPMAKYADKGRDGKYRVNVNGLRYITEYSTQREGKNVVEGVKAKMETEKGEMAYDIPKSAYKRKTPEEMAVAIRKESQKETSPEVRLRGLQLDDKVAYYRKKTGESGEGFVSSVTTYSKNVVNENCFSLSTSNGFIKGIGYAENMDMFLESTGDEIQIIKI